MSDGGSLEDRGGKGDGDADRRRLHYYLYIRLSGSVEQLPPRGKDCPTLRIDSIGGLSYEVHIPDAHSSYFRLRPA